MPHTSSVICPPNVTQVPARENDILVPGNISVQCIPSVAVCEPIPELWHWLRDAGEFPGEKSVLFWAAAQSERITLSQRLLALYLYRFLSAAVTPVWKSSSLLTFFSLTVCAWKKEQLWANGLQALLRSQIKGKTPMRRRH